MSNPNRIKRPKLKEIVRERLLEIIQTGFLKPGDVLPSERELMALFEVGRPAIREAMQDLQRMGLIEIRHGGLPRVIEPSTDMMAEQMTQSMWHLLSFSEDTMRNLKDARLLFEIQMARLAAANRSPDDVVRLRKVVEEQRDARYDSDRFTQCDREFHCALAAISGNPLFSSLAGAIFDWLAHFKVALVSQPGLEELTTHEHEMIIDAVERGEVEAAEKAMADHLNRANDLYRKPREVPDPK